MPAALPTSLPPPPPGALARRAFGTALGFLAVAAALGALLRWQTVRPLAAVNYGYLLHAHSHTAFLGWVFNAFFAVALASFIPAGEHRACGRLFLVLQVAVLGMLASFPFQGYGLVSIAFSTLHMGGSVAFAWRLWRRHLAAPAARGHLRVALGFLVVSGLGPLALGPLAAFGLRDTPAYHLAIYFYLHAQYNGWFLFFLQAVLFQALAQHGLPVAEADARRALRWLAVGAVLTLAQSTLWLDPPGWVYVVAGLGGVAQLAGCAWLLRALRGAGALFAGPARLLAGLALAAFLLKHALQAAAAWPPLNGLTNHRFIAIAFLHLVFLGVVAPALFAWALRLGWLRAGRMTGAGLALFLGGAIFTELLLVASALGAVPSGLPQERLLLAAALVMVAGAGALVAAFAGGRASEGSKGT